MKHDQISETVVAHLVDRDLPQSALNALRRTLASASTERQLQAFIQRIPTVLVQHLRSGGERWVIPQKRLGAEYVPDFLIGSRSSAGLEWQAVELESPRAAMFTKTGEQSQQLRHAVRQIQDWRSWLLRNNAYAATAPDHNGLGLTEIRSDLPGLILISRRSGLDPKWNELRKQITSDLNIQIHTYDWLVENIKDRIALRSRIRRRAK